MRKLEKHKSFQAQGTNYSALCLQQHPLPSSLLFFFTYTSSSTRRFASSFKLIQLAHAFSYYQCVFFRVKNQVVEDYRRNCSLSTVLLHSHTLTSMGFSIYMHLLTQSDTKKQTESLLKHVIVFIHRMCFTHIQHIGYVFNNSFSKVSVTCTTTATRCPLVYFKQLFIYCMQQLNDRNTNNCAYLDS